MNDALYIFVPTIGLVIFFVLVCPVDGCDLNGVVLHDLVKRYGGEEMFGRWRRARWTSTCPEDWLPIKNRKS